MGGRWGAQKMPCVKRDSSSTGISTILSHAFPLRPERSCHHCKPQCSLLFNTLVCCKSGKKWTQLGVFGMDYSSLLASSSHLLIVDDGLGGFAREPVFNLLCLLGPKRARGNYSP